MERFITFTLGCLLTVLCAYLIQEFLAKPYAIPSSSMADTLNIGDKILVQRLGADPGVGDVAVFYAPKGAAKPECGDPLSGIATGKPCSRSAGGEGSQPYVKRIVGVEGDRIAFNNGKLIRNGKPVKEPYAALCADPVICQMPVPITVPKGMVFMVGDNRNHSSDSRVWGPVPREWVVGQVRAVWWPLKQAHGL